MKDFEAPEGYAPYRLFRYEDDHRSFTIRPDAYEGARVERNWDETDAWVLIITLRNSGNIRVPFGAMEERAARACHNSLTLFVEKDALRHVQNGLSRKARTNAG